MNHRWKGALDIAEIGLEVEFLTFGLNAAGIWASSGKTLHPSVSGGIVWCATCESPDPSSHVKSAWFLAEGHRTDVEDV